MHLAGGGGVASVFFKRFKIGEGTLELVDCVEHFFGEGVLVDGAGEILQVGADVANRAPHIQDGGGFIEQRGRVCGGSWIS